MRMIVRIILIGMKKIATYREYLIFSAIKNGIYIFIQYMLWKNILSYQNRSAELGVIMLYFIINQFIDVFYANVASHISEDIQEGSIIVRLCKPVAIEKQYFFEALGSSVTKVCTLSIVNLCLLLYFSTDYNLVRILLMVVLISLGYVLHFVLELFFGSLAFFTQSIWGIDSFKTAITAIFSGTLFPIFFYPDWLKGVVELLPFPYTTGKIAEYYVLNTNFSQIAMIQLLYIVVIYMLYKGIMKIGIGKLTINGG